MLQRLHIRFLFVLFITITLGGCSVKSIYHQLDWVLLGTVEDFVTLSEAQNKEVKQRIEIFLDWHRREQVPLYVRDLQQIKKDAADGLTQDEIDARFALMMQRWYALRDRAAPDLAEMLITVSETQKREILAQLQARNEEIREEYEELNAQAREERIYDRLVEHFERWLGDLDANQLAYLRTQSNAFQSFHTERVAFRENWQAAFRKILESSDAAHTRMEKFRELLQQPETLQSQVYKDKLAFNLRQTQQLILGIDKTLSPKQRAHLLERLDHFIGLFQQIAAGT